MHYVLTILGSVGLIVGSLTLSFLLCLGLLQLFRLVGHPDWGPMVALAVAIASMLLPVGELLRLTGILVVPMAIPFWFEGRAWRVRGIRADA